MLNMLFPKKDEQEKKVHYSNPGWLRWVVFIFMLYAAYTIYTQDPSVLQVNPNNFAPNTDTPSGLQALPPQTNTNTIIGQNISMIAAQTDVSTHYQKGGEILGNGDVADCGQLATIKAEATTQDGLPLAGFGADRPADTMTIGTDKAAWFEGVRGMRVGGVREVYIPLSDIVDTKTLEEKKWNAASLARFKLQLQKLEPSSPAGTLGFQVFDLMAGQGEQVQCGNKVTAHVDVWARNGSKAFTTKDKSPLTLTVGAVPYFYGLDRAVVDQRAGGARRVIVTPEYLRAPASNTPSEDATIKGLLAAIGKDDLVIMDVYLISVEKPQK